MKKIRFRLSDVIAIAAALCFAFCLWHTRSHTFHELTEPDGQPTIAAAHIATGNAVSVMDYAADEEDLAELLRVLNSAKYRRTLFPEAEDDTYVLITFTYADGSGRYLLFYEDSLRLETVNRSGDPYRHEFVRYRLEGVSEELLAQTIRESWRQLSQ